MFCPKCKSEYREGFYKCADCDVYLVDVLPPEQTDNLGNVEFVEVFSTYSQGDIVFVKSVLDGEGITYFFQGEISARMITAGASRLMVATDDADRAREILQEMGFLERA
jgi:hypothetical protein